MHQASKCVWGAGVIDVVSAVSTATAIKTPATIYPADAQNAAPSSAFRFGIRNLLAGIGSDLSPTLEGYGCETAFAVNRRFFDRETGRKFQFH